MICKVRSTGLMSLQDDENEEDEEQETGEREGESSSPVRLSHHVKWNR